jgi:hypothetical protein
MTETIYIPLLDEGVEVQRPARAYRRADGAYIVLRPVDYDPEAESWAFPPGSTVICEARQTAEGTFLKAVGLAQEEALSDRRAS